LLEKFMIFEANQVIVAGAWPNCACRWRIPRRSHSLATDDAWRRCEKRRAVNGRSPRADEIAVPTSFVIATG
jgi:hypothetical protein